MKVEDLRRVQLDALAEQAAERKTAGEKENEEAVRNRARGVSDANTFVQSWLDEAQNAAKAGLGKIKFNIGSTDSRTMLAYFCALSEEAERQLRELGFTVEAESRYETGAYDNAMECHTEGSTSFTIRISWGST